MTTLPTARRAVLPSARRAVAVALVLLAALAGVAACGTAQAGQSASHQVSALDRHWLYQTHRADMLETTAGELAETNAMSPSIKAAGAMLFRDHTAFDHKVLDVAAALHVRMINNLTLLEYETRDRLGKELGYQFDHDFVASMMTAHQQLIALTKTELRHGSSPQVQALAQQALPMLEKHLAVLRKVAGSG